MKQEKWKKGESFKKNAEITSSDTLREEVTKTFYEN